jgi:ATP-dependent RNA helicase RhlE
VAIAFCSDDEAPLLRDIEKLTRQAIPRIDRRQPGAQHSAPAATRHPPRPPQAQRRPGGAAPPGGFRGRPPNRRRAQG